MFFFHQKNEGKRGKGKNTNIQRLGFRNLAIAKCSQEQRWCKTQKRQREEGLQAAR